MKANVRDFVRRSTLRLRGWREENRHRLHLDDRIVVSWNGLMVSYDVYAPPNVDVLFDERALQINALEQAAVSLPEDRHPRRRAMPGAGRRPHRL